jgi:hypothetical protein
VLLDSRSRQRGVMSPPAVERLLDDARGGVHGAADGVWSLLNLELWYRTFIDGDGIQTLSERDGTATDASSHMGRTVRPELTGASSR